MLLTLLPPLPLLLAMNFIYLNAIELYLLQKCKSLIEYSDCGEFVETGEEDVGNQCFAKIMTTKNLVAIFIDVMPCQRWLVVQVSGGRVRKNSPFPGNNFISYSRVKRNLYTTLHNGCKQQQDKTSQHHGISAPVSFHAFEVTCLFVLCSLLWIFWYECSQTELQALYKYLVKCFFINKLER